MIILSLIINIFKLLPLMNVSIVLTESLIVKYKGAKPRAVLLKEFKTDLRLHLAN